MKDHNDQHTKRLEALAKDQHIKNLEALAKEMASALEAVDSTVHFAKKLNNLSSDAVEAVDATLHFAKKVDGLSDDGQSTAQKALESYYRFTMREKHEED